MDLHNYHRAPEVSSADDPAHAVVIDAGVAPRHKSRLEAALLAMFFGGLGIHRLYLRRYRIGLVQLLLTMSAVTAILLWPQIGEVCLAAVCTILFVGWWGWMEGTWLLLGLPFRDGKGARLRDAPERLLATGLFIAFWVHVPLVLLVALILFSPEFLPRKPAMRSGVNSIQLTVSAPAAPQETQTRPIVITAPAPPPAFNKDVTQRATLAENYPLTKRPTLPNLEIAKHQPFSLSREVQAISQVEALALTRQTVTLPDAPNLTDATEQQVARSASHASVSSLRRTGVQTDSLPDKIDEFCPEPVYPAEELDNRIEGSVDLRVRVGRDGRVLTVSIRISSGRAAFDQAALAAVKQWRFEPARIVGVAVTKDIAVGIDFKIAANVER